MPFQIHKNISKASTLPSDFYRDFTHFEASKEKIFASTWQYVADANVVEEQGAVYPFTFLTGVLDEPLLLTHDRANQVHCLSNVCTHRGKIIVEKAGKNRLLSCGYHGRCFHLDGQFKSMPQFEKTENFPSEADNLTKIHLRKWLGLYFISLEPKLDFEELIRPIQDRVGWMPLNTLEFNEEGTKDYSVNAHWALYCDNYLEGFHVPFVHPALNQALDFGSYDYEIFPYCNLQVGIAGEGEPHFDIPKGSPDYGRKVYAYYFWLFPNLMLNFYPWGLSLNYVQPISHNQTIVSFRTYKFKNASFQRTANNLENTEIEDEAVVENVQLGIQSRYYKSGRFSPTMEKGVHHFHGLIDDFFSK
ncbi:MAG: Rieske 2Fe-2S domain-containing protein [Bacteroidetes bacterium]|jgi:choline monooxygenase|nr:Rieske 2Fe-2S domain-containing protein [Bacteroidota bacterium]MDF1867845.1 SRPBCC family protein [Saprospiraceae bacterium]